MTSSTDDTLLRAAQQRLDAACALKGDHNAAESAEYNAAHAAFAALTGAADALMWAAERLDDAYGGTGTMEDTPANRAELAAARATFDELAGANPTIVLKLCNDEPTWHCVLCGDFSHADGPYAPFIEGTYGAVCLSCFEKSHANSGAAREFERFNEAMDILDVSQWWEREQARRPKLYLVPAPPNR